MEKRVAILVLLLAWSCAVPAFAQLVEVHGFRVEGQQVVVEYTLAGVEEGAPIQVSLHWLEQGSARENDCQAVAGAVGDQKAQPGRRQRIAWDLLADYPMGMDLPGVSFVVKVRRIPEGFVLVHGGSFQMQNGTYSRSPVDSVTVSDFLMGKHEVTQRLWQEVMGGNPSYFKTGNGQADCPVEQVSWYDAVAFCNKLSVREGLVPCYNGSGNGITCNWTANGYRLPTEAEWEYAAGGGAGTRTKYSWGDGSPTGNAGNIADETAKRRFPNWTIAEGYEDGHVYTAPVGSFSPNRLGLYDISGNVFEWCWDRYTSYTSRSQTNPRGPSSGSYRVIRGGSYNYDAYLARVANRYFFTPDNQINYIGFRLVRSAPSR